MKDNSKTIIFAAAAVLLCMIALVSSPKKNIDSLFVDLGSEFYPDFTDPLKAASLEVIGTDKDTGILLPFKVALKNGRWVIPSHQDYPADAKDKVAKIAANLVGVTRDELRSELPSDHESLEVVAPDAKTPGGKGIRVTMKDANGNMLCDYILGKEIEDRSGWRYVRTPGQSKTFAVKLDLDFSTKFSDWVETGLLDMTSTSARSLEVMNYSVTQGQIVEKGRFGLFRKGSDDWTTPSKMAADKQLAQSKINDVISELSDVKIAGVRKKPDSLIKLLSGKSAQLTPDSQLSLQEKGFYLSEGTILGDEGQFVVKKDNGITYIVIFGVGFNDDSLNVSSSKDKKKDAKVSGRYMFVSVSYDDAFQPEPALGKEPAKLAESAKEDEKKKYDAALKEFETAKEAHDDWKKEVEETKKEVAKLQKRFTDWYYVIANESYDKVKVSLPDLLEDKPKEDKEKK